MNNSKYDIWLVTDEMQTICRSHFLQQVYRKIEGAVLDSQNERNLDCVTTFQTHSILQRFMIHFDRLQLDCNDHLFIFDGAHAVGAHKVSESMCFHLYRLIVIHYLPFSETKWQHSIWTYSKITNEYIFFR